MKNRIRARFNCRGVPGKGSAREFPIVCIGMSAGSLVPLKVIFRKIEPNTGAAFVLIHHLRHSPTLLPQILPALTTMSVELASAHTLVRPNHVYIIPSGQDIAMTDGHFSLRPNSKTRGWPIVMTLFLNSLLHSNHPGIAVILSGADSDGVGAFKDFKRAGGITIVQDPWSAEHPEMPMAAIKTSCADYILEPAEIAEQIQKSCVSLSVDQRCAASNFAGKERLNPTATPPLAADSP